MIMVCLSCVLCPHLRSNILVQTEEVVRIIMRFDRYHALPACQVSFWHSLLLISTHEIYVDARCHRGSQLLKERASPGNMLRVGSRVGPIRQKVRDERSSAIAKRGLVSANLAGCPTEIGEFDLSFRRRNRGQGVKESFYRNVLEILKIPRLRVITTAMGKGGVSHGLQFQE